MVIDDNAWSKFFEQPMDVKPSKVTYPGLSGNIAPSSFTVPEDASKVKQAEEKFLAEKLQHYLVRGSDVLSTIEAHETSHIGELADTINNMLQLLKRNVALTNQQWKWLTELTHSINELIGEPNDPGPIDPNTPSCERT